MVDDNPVVRRLVSQECECAFDVVLAADAEQAAALLRSCSDLCAVVTDLCLGAGPDGLDVLREARLQAGDGVRLLISGAYDPSRIDTALASGLAHAFVQKPWPPGRLANKLHEALERSTPAGPPDHAR